MLVALRKEARIVLTSRGCRDQSIKSMDLSGDAVQGSFTDLAEHGGLSPTRTWASLMCTGFEK